ncbi:crossover junction endodeoxyribonuclease RuvC [Candidatus Fermentibacterales bacterium]|nr:crossover junction endodeoxyribonuclease RuvC [Candidatus Fermentibacterales bacterium]
MREPGHGAIYLGLDPGLNTTGYGLVSIGPGSPVRLVDAGTIRTSASDGLSKRLMELHEGARELVRGYEPVAIGIEKVYSHYRHPATAIVMAHARGVLCLVAALEGVPLVELPSTRIKKLLTGNGRASKAQVNGMVRRMLGVREEISPDDVSDALAAAIAMIEEEENARRACRQGH